MAANLESVCDKQIEAGWNSWHYSEGVRVELGATAKTHSVIADLANFVASQRSRGSLALASAAAFDLQTKTKEEKKKKTTERLLIGL